MKKQTIQKPQMYRQGDVALVKINSIPKSAKRQEPGNPILAYGEVTGHHHQVQSSGAALCEAPEATFLDLPGAADLTHQEHATIALPAGTYRLVHQREYHPEAIRRVVD